MIRRIFVVALAAWALGQSPLTARTFTNSAGRQIEAEVVEVEGETVVLKMNGKNYPVPIATLSQEDRDYLAAWKKEKEAPSAEKKTAGTIGNFEGLVPGEWPVAISAGDDGKEYEIVENEDGSYTYRSPHFEFHVSERLSMSVVKEFARIFEATFQFLDQAPFGLAPQPAGSGHYQTNLYKTREEYAAVGGSTNSAGHFTYSYSMRPGALPGETKFNKALIEIPMPSLGVEYTGRRYIIDHSKQNKTLIHEIVHQVMMRWLPVIPTWMSEGFAEFVESQDYSGGRYRTTNLTRAVKENVTNGNKEFTMVPLERLMTISSREWSEELASSLGAGSKNYRSSNLLLTYFALLDGDGKGEGLINFLEGVSRGLKADVVAEETLLRGRSYAELEEDVKDAWDSEGIDIIFY